MTDEVLHYEGVWVPVRRCDAENGVTLVRADKGEHLVIRQVRADESVEDAEKHAAEIVAECHIGVKYMLNLDMLRSKKENHKLTRGYRIKFESWEEPWGFTRHLGELHRGGGCDRCRGYTLLPWPCGPN